MVSKNILCRCEQLLVTLLVIVLGLNKCYCHVNYVHIPKYVMEVKQLLF